MSLRKWKKENVGRVYSSNSEVYLNIYTLHIIERNRNPTSRNCWVGKAENLSVVFIMLVKRTERNYAFACAEWVEDLSDMLKLNTNKPFINKWTVTILSISSYTLNTTYIFIYMAKGEDLPTKLVENQNAKNKYENRIVLRNEF